MREKASDKGCFRTRLALLMMNLTSEPLAALYSLLPFILRKDLGASTYQITLFITLRPILSVFAFYWGAYLSRRRNRLLSNLMGAWFLARVPFLFFPFVDSFWFLLLACGIYQLFSKAATPAMMEILKRNVPKKPREHIFSLYFVLSFVESVVLGIVLGNILDGGTSNWKMLFLVSALIGLTSLLIQRRIEVPSDETQAVAPLSKNRLIAPLKQSFALLRERGDFAYFQWGYMVGGMALMLIAPALSIFYADTLSLTHMEMTVARLIFMGLAVVFSTFFWKNQLEKMSIFRLMAWILLGFALFPLILLFAEFYPPAIYLAFLIYGIAQSGSHLVWNLSGTIFSGDKDSSPFTTINVLMIGLRGAVGPVLGGVLCEQFGPAPILVLGSLLSILGAGMMLRKRAEVEIKNF